MTETYGCRTGMEREMADARAARAAWAIEPMHDRMEMVRRLRHFIAQHTGKLTAASTAATQPAGERSADRAGNSASGGAPFFGAGGCGAGSAAATPNASPRRKNGRGLQLSSSFIRVLRIGNSRRAPWGHSYALFSCLRGLDV